jgi:hypothetical protein
MASGRIHTRWVVPAPGATVSGLQETPEGVTGGRHARETRARESMLTRKSGSFVRDRPIHAPQGHILMHRTRQPDFRDGCWEHPLHMPRNALRKRPAVASQEGLGQFAQPTPCPRSTALTCVAWSTLLRLALRLDMPLGCSSSSVPRIFATYVFCCSVNAKRRHRGSNTHTRAVHATLLTAL